MYLPTYRRSLLAFVTVVLALLSFQAAPCDADTELIVRVDPTKVSIESVASRLGLSVVRPLDAARSATFLVESDADPGAILSSLRREPGVLHAELDRTLVFPEDSPEIDAANAQLAIAAWASDDDAQTAFADKGFTDHFGDVVWRSYVQQKAAELIRVEEAHYDHATGAGIVAVIDSGIDPEHAALEHRLVGGFDFVRNLEGLPSEWDDLDTSTRTKLEQSTVAILGQSTIAILGQSTVAILGGDAAKALDAPQYRAFGHGTMVAGIVRLVAPNARIMPLKAFRADGTGQLSDVIRAIYYAIDQGASVINMSFSLDIDSPALDDAVEEAEEEDIVCVSSVGNEGREREDVYPAYYDDVAGIAATDDDDRLSVLSNYGSEIVTMAAPGEGVVTTYPGSNYAARGGHVFQRRFRFGRGRPPHRARRRHRSRRRHGCT